MPPNKSYPVWQTLLHWHDFFSLLKNTIQRFPLSILAILLLSISAFLLLNYHKEFAYLDKLLVFSIQALVAFTAFTLYREAENKESLNYFVMGCSVITAAISVFIATTFEDAFLSIFSLFSVAIVLALLFAPFGFYPLSKAEKGEILANKVNDNSASFWYFNFQTLTAIFFAAITALILGVGLSIIFASMTYLFDIQFNQYLYGNIWLFVWSLLFPFYILVNIDNNFDYQQQNCQFPKGVRIIASYILVPLMSIYIVVLYAYMVKILLQWQLPQGNVGWMVSIFGIVGITTKMIIYPLRKIGSRSLILFESYFYPTLLCPTLLLFLAISVRINDYGVTESRYAIGLIGLWFLIVSLLAIFQPRQFHLKTAAVMLSFLCLIASFGPWGMQEFSTQSQVKRFTLLLKQHGLFKGGQALNAKRENIRVPSKAIISIDSIANYLARMKKGRKLITPMFKSLIAQSQDQTKNSVNNTLNSGYQIMLLLGLEAYPEHTVLRNEKNTASFNYSSDNYFKTNALDISGFDTMQQGMLMEQYGSRQISTAAEVCFNGNGVSVCHTSQAIVNGVLTLSIGDEQILFNVTELVETMHKDDVYYLTEDKISLVSQEKLSESGKVKAKLILTEVHAIFMGNHWKLVSGRYVLLVKFISQNEPNTKKEGDL